MAHRTFTDRQSVAWQVWDVMPASDVRNTLQGGWLVFESATERRRLAPVPLYWVHAPEVELDEMLGRARVVPRPDGIRTGPHASFGDAPEANRS